MSSCECHGLQHYVDAFGLNLCVSFVVHLGTLHFMVLIVSQFRSQFPHVLILGLILLPPGLVLSRLDGDALFSKVRLALGDVCTG